MIKNDNNNMQIAETANIFGAHQNCNIDSTKISIL